MDDSCGLTGDARGNRARCYRTLILAIVLAASACASSGAVLPSASTAPSTAVDIAGSWTGTLESSNLATRTITMTIVQTGTCVDGAWATTPKEWDGAISGVADATSFVGNISFETSTGNACTGVGVFSGAASTQAIDWSSTGFTGTCPTSLPQGVTVKLQAQATTGHGPSLGPSPCPQSWHPSSVHPSSRSTSDR